jgi:H+/Cl- antiporter ClcA
MNPQTGKWVIIAGIVIVIAGILIYFFHDKLNWLGKLPGDIRIEKDNFRFYFPLTTMIIISVVLSILISIFKKFF